MVTVRDLLEFIFTLRKSEPTPLCRKLRPATSYPGIVRPRESIDVDTMAAKMITDRRFLFRPPIPVKTTGILQKTPEFRKNSITSQNEFPV